MRIKLNETNFPAYQKTKKPIEFKTLFFDKEVSEKYLKNQDSYYVTYDDPVETLSFMDYISYEIEYDKWDFDKMNVDIKKGLSIAQEIVDEVKYEKTESDKKKKLFDIFVKVFNYDYEFRDNAVNPDGFAIANWWTNLPKPKRYKPNTIQSLFLDKKGICNILSEAYKMFCDHPDINIPCETIRGRTTPINENTDVCYHHGWNMVMDEGEWKHVDITRALYNKNDGKDVYEYYLLTNDELKEKGPHHDYEESYQKNINK